MSELTVIPRQFEKSVVLADKIKNEVDQFPDKIKTLVGSMVYGTPSDQLAIAIFKSNDELIEMPSDLTELDPQSLEKNLEAVLELILSIRNKINQKTGLIGFGFTFSTIGAYVLYEAFSRLDQLNPHSDIQKVLGALFVLAGGAAFIYKYILNQKQSKLVSQLGPAATIKTSEA